jgi:hypothetical protein
MTDQFTWRRIIEIDYARLLTGFDDDGITLGFADADQDDDDPVAALRWNSDDTAALLADLLRFVADDGQDYAGGYDPRIPQHRPPHSRMWAITRHGDDLVLLTDVSAEIVAAVRIPIAAVPAVIGALQQAMDGRDDLQRFDEAMGHAYPGDFDDDPGVS